MADSSPNDSRPRVVIAGGGVAGVEALLALDEFAGDRIDLTLVASQPEFVFRPMLVEEPFASWPAARHELAPVVEERGGQFILASVQGVDAEHHVLRLDSGEIDYDLLVVCLGGRMRPAYPQVITFPRPEPLRIDEVLDQLAPGSLLSFVVPPGVHWALPVYELALMTQRRVRERSLEIEIAVFTPEEKPLILFGEVASNAVAEMLGARDIELHAGVYVRQLADGSLKLMPGDGTAHPAATIALPRILGPALPGLPADDDGFILIDDHCRVRGLEDVWAAGDGTNFPVKQGGLATQQADAAVAQIAAQVGRPGEPEIFHPVLRGQLITGDESLNMLKGAAGGEDDGVASADYLWWPPSKISGRFISDWLDDREGIQNLLEPEGAIDVEVKMPSNWYDSPLSLDPYSPPPRD